MSKLAGKIALITGGSDGIGLAIAMRFLSEGAEHVFITGRRQEMLDEAVKKLHNTKVSAVQADVSKLTDLDKLYSIIKNEKGRLDILVANAAVAGYTRLGSVTEEFFDETYGINVKGVLFTVQKALPIFSDGGSIILVGSIGSIKGRPEHCIYGGTKAAVRSFARCWSVDLKERRIRVNTLSPGPIETDMLRAIPHYEAVLDYIKQNSPLGRCGTPDEVAKTAVFLASDDSSYITGIELFVDGGLAQI